MTRAEQQPLVTIAIPTYNRAEAYLPQALSSVCAQTYPKLDILVSDNASADGTEAVVASFNDPRIRYHRHKENVGGPANWDFCIRQARGEYFQLLNDDDLIDTDFVVSCMARVGENPDAGLIRTGTRVIDGGGRLIDISPNYVDGLDFAEFVLAWIDGRTAPYLCSTLFRTKPLQEIGLSSKHNLWDDVRTEFRIAAAHGRIDIPEVKASFRMHDNELTSSAAIRNWCEDSLELLETICALVPPHQKEPIWQRGLAFLAMFNYRIAVRLDASWTDRLAACMEVYRMLGRTPRVRRLLYEVARQNRMMNRIRSWRYGNAS